MEVGARAVLEGDGDGTLGVGPGQGEGLTSLNNVGAVGKLDGPGRSGGRDDGEETSSELHFCDWGGASLVVLVVKVDAKTVKKLGIISAD